MNTAGPATHRAVPARSLFESLAALARQVLDLIASVQMRRAERQIMRLGQVESLISQGAFVSRAQGSRAGSPVLRTDRAMRS